ncbi:MAG: DUF4145 domain-containing protein [Pseudomonadota bacterium]
MHKPPTIRETDFNCPHCGAHAEQRWLDCSTNIYGKNYPPKIFYYMTEVREYVQYTDGNDKKASELIRGERMLRGRPFVQKQAEPRNCAHNIENLFLSVCFNCEEVAVWVRDNLIWPPTNMTHQPHVDMPADIASDFIEASSIVEKSPRGAAALLRLCVQKLCVALGEKGRNINDDIASLVKKGLDTKVQRALDIVRVIGNDAVHPGEMSLKDDMETAALLFSLVNIITDSLISQPKRIEEFYASLPEGKIKAIEERDS